jgi:hypothetical protein
MANFIDRTPASCFEAGQIRFQKNSGPDSGHFAAHHASPSRPPSYAKRPSVKCTAKLTFEPNYESDSGRVALRQLGKAGFRLAALLTAIFESE